MAGVGVAAMAAYLGATMTDFWDLVNLDAETTTMKIEAGKKYVRRDGGITRPLVSNADGTGRYPLAERPGSHLAWTTEGRYWYSNLGRPDAHPADLVAEYPEPVTMPDSHYEYVPGPLDIEANEALANLARAQAYAEELVEDDYLWVDASPAYVRRVLDRLIKLLGVEV